MKIKLKVTTILSVAHLFHQASFLFNTDFKYNYASLSSWHKFKNSVMLEKEMLLHSQLLMNSHFHFLITVKSVSSNILLHQPSFPKSDPTLMLWRNHCDHLHGCLAISELSAPVSDMLHLHHTINIHSYKPVINFKMRERDNSTIKTNSLYKLLHGTTFQVHINLSHV